MIHFQVWHLMGVLKCHQLIAVPITTGKKEDTVVCPLLRHSNYDREKKIQLSGYHLLRRFNCHCCAVPITTGKKDTVICPLLRRSKYDQKKKQKSGGCAIVITTGKKVLVICLAGAWSLLRPEKKVLVVCWAQPVPITTGKKDTVVCPLLRRSK